jgi:DNA (cytosine-5)-methyltransferase 1
VKPRCLDLFCGAGGCSAGYARAGYDVTGVDIKPQPRYQFAFILGDALEYVEAHGHEYDLIHASPPCQRFIRLAKQQQTHLRHRDLIEATRRALRATGRPYVIENVEGAPLVDPLMLCGTMFGLRVIRHRLFETEPAIWWPPTLCMHPKQGPGRRGNEGTGEWVSVYGHFSGVPKARAAMGIDWSMTQHDLAQAIPPAFTEWIGRQIIDVALAPR